MPVLAKGDILYVFSGNCSYLVLCEILYVILFVRKLLTFQGVTLTINDWYDCVTRCEQSHCLTSHTRQDEIDAEDFIQLTIC